MLQQLFTTKIIVSRLKQFKQLFFKNKNTKCFNFRRFCFYHYIFSKKSADKS